MKMNWNRDFLEASRIESPVATAIHPCQSFPIRAIRRLLKIWLRPSAALGNPWRLHEFRLPLRAFAAPAFHPERPGH
jgi:hypothetical protein